MEIIIYIQTRMEFEQGDRRTAKFRTNICHLTIQDKITMNYNYSKDTGATYQFCNHSSVK
jgi:hypothetical protein